MSTWDFYFPSQIERIMWRYASVYCLVFEVVGGFYMWMWHLKLFDKYKSTSLPTNEMGAVDLRRRKGIRHYAERLLNKLRKLSPSTPLRLLYPVSFLCGLYCIFRTYIFIEDVIGLRALPLSAYVTVD